MGDLELNEVWRLMFVKLREVGLIGHNLKYDEFKLTLAGFGDRRYRTMRVVSDTLIKTRVIFPEMPQKRLCDVSSLWTREPFYKDEGKEFKLGKSKIEQLLLYNAKDCAVEKEVDEEQEIDLVALQERHNVPLVDYYYKYQMRKHKLYLRMENVGLDVDLDRQKELRKEYKGMAAVVHARIFSAVGHELNVKSAPQMFDFLYKELRFKALKRAPTSEDAIVRLMANHAKRRSSMASKSKTSLPMYLKRDGYEINCPGLLTSALIMTTLVKARSILLLLRLVVLPLVFLRSRYARRKWLVFPHNTGAWSFG
jgi:DNA polymerase I-like protein with 3'-5' exonuclease and polymerase domains